MEFSNGENASYLEFWAYDDAFLEFGQKLNEFPQSVESTVTFQLGEEDLAAGLGAGYAHYLLLQLSYHKRQNVFAIHVRVKKADEKPFHYQSEFFIWTHPAQLNRWGQKLSTWKPHEEQELQWVLEL
ncbi:hypothetical protein [Hymenobacter sp. CRA2]|uniref:hypothetical protein n=1 Tax=Hymenobacter sp. CRA2 TaxID=1955620 RepID=UPI0011170978|nr:hypothetical protein [Hymenobacter sp. CRA2]